MLCLASDAFEWWAVTQDQIATGVEPIAMVGILPCAYPAQPKGPRYPFTKRPTCAEYGPTGLLPRWRPRRGWSARPIPAQPDGEGAHCVDEPWRRLLISPDPGNSTDRHQFKCSAKSGRTKASRDCGSLAIGRPLNDGHSCFCGCAVR